LTVQEDGKVKYENMELFQGVLAYFVKWFVLSGLKQSVTAFAVALKKRSEERS
jgi:hypothetical protein